MKGIIIVIIIIITTTTTTCLSLDVSNMLHLFHLVIIARVMLMSTLHQSLWIASCFKVFVLGEWEMHSHIGHMCLTWLLILTWHLYLSGVWFNLVLKRGAKKRCVLKRSLYVFIGWQPF